MTKIKLLFSISVLAAGVTLQSVHADGTALTWNGSGGDAWNATSGNWLDGETPTAWVDGASATNPVKQVILA